jgi:hypothetical protein
MKSYPWFTSSPRFTAYASFKRAFGRFAKKPSYCVKIAKRSIKSGSHRKHVVLFCTRTLGLSFSIARRRDSVVFTNAPEPRLRIPPPTTLPPHYTPPPRSPKPKPAAPSCSLLSPPLHHHCHPLPTCSPPPPPLSQPILSMAGAWTSDLLVLLHWGHHLISTSRRPAMERCGGAQRYYGERRRGAECAGAESTRVNDEGLRRAAGHQTRRGLLTPKFGKESDLWVQLGQESVSWKERIFSDVFGKEVCGRLFAPIRQRNSRADFAGLDSDVAQAGRTNGWIGDQA